MVTKLKRNKNYIDYIRKKIKLNFPEWEEHGKAVCELQINNNFQIDFIAKIQGYPDSVYKVSFVKDRGLLELRLFEKKIIY